VPVLEYKTTERSAVGRGRSLVEGASTSLVSLIRKRAPTVMDGFV